MPLAYRRTSRLGLQWIPPFSKWVTLHQLAQCWEAYPEAPGFPAATSIYNIACLAMFPRARLGVSVNVHANQAMSRTYWSTQVGQGIRCLFGETQIAVPQGAELIAVSWLKPPDEGVQEGGLGPFPEDLFRVQFGLAL